MKYLITGGAGFIGSHLTEKLVSRGDQVVVFDNLSTGLAQNLVGVKNLIEFVEGSILDEELTNSLVNQSDYVVHFAAALGVLNILNKPLESLQTNLKGSGIIVEAAYKFKKPILIASTSEIYGKNVKEFLSENDDRIIGNPLKLRWAYSEAKAIDESLAYFYFLEKNLPVRIVRFFNTVGPRQIGDYGMVLPRFVNAAMKNENIEVYGSGEQIRSFCHVFDVLRALLLVMDSPMTTGEVFNIGNDKSISILNLAKKVIKVTNSNSSIKLVNYSEAYSEGFEDMLRRVPDISKIKKFLGWTPEINLDQIIRDVVTFNSK